MSPIVLVPVPASVPVLLSVNSLLLSGDDILMLGESACDRKMSFSLAGTIIPVQRQRPLVQLTPISSNTKVQPSQTITHVQGGHHQMPVLLPKQSQVWTI